MGTPWRGGKLSTWRVYPEGEAKYSNAQLTFFKPYETCFINIFAHLELSPTIVLSKLLSRAVDWKCESRVKWNIDSQLWNSGTPCKVSRVHFYRVANICHVLIILKVSKIVLRAIVINRIFASAVREYNESKEKKDDDNLTIWEEELAQEASGFGGTILR